MLSFFEKRPIITITVIVFIMLLPHLATPNLTIMEARNFLTAKEMVQDNHWLLTTMNGEPRYQKPPLPTWLSAIFGLLLGITNLFALRLPAAIMVLFLGIFGFLLIKKLTKNKTIAFYSGLLAITSFYIIGIINEAPWDIYAHGFMIASIYYLFSFFISEKNKWVNIICSALFMGASILSKGPVSLYVLFLPFILSYGISFGYKEFKKKIIPLLLFIALFIIMGGWWFLYVRLIDSEAFLKIATKETGNWNSYNVRPFYYYWSFFIQSGIWAILAFVGLWYPYLIKRVSNVKAYKLCFWWTIISVILLSIIPEKKSRYLMPVLIPLAFNTSFYINFLVNNFKNLKLKEKIPIYLHAIIISIIGLIVPIVLYFLLKNNISNYWFWYIATSISVFTLAIIILKNKNSVKIIFYATVLFMASILVFGLPIIKQFNSSNYSKTINLLHQNTKKRFKTYSYKDISPEILWYYNSRVKKLDFKKSLPKENKFNLLLTNDNIKTIIPILEKEFTVNKQFVIDLNPTLKKKERLIQHYFFITKK